MHIVSLHRPSPKGCLPAIFEVCEGFPLGIEGARGQNFNKKRHLEDHPARVINTLLLDSHML